MSDELKGFTVRAYGLLVQNNKILATRELIRGEEYLKFPGGGVELGEGMHETVVREFKEELNLDVQVDDHIYTSDYFVQSAFKPQYQVIAVYYQVSITGSNEITVLDKDIKALEWLDRESHALNKLSLALDRKAFEELLKR